MSGKHKRRNIAQVEILDMVAEGKCIARHDEKVIFVEGVVPQDVVDLRIVKEKKNFAEAVPVHFHTFSPLRTEAFCSHFGVCGGCKWQNLDYETQLHYKQKQVKDSLERIGKAQLPEIKPIVPSKQTTYYRNKLEYTFSNRKWLTTAEIGSDEQFDRNALGFHIPKRFDKILDIEHCYLQPEPSNAIRLAVKAYAQVHEFDFFDLVAMEGLMRNLIIRNASTGDLMVIVQFYRNDAEAIAGLMQHLADAFPEITSLLYVINPKGNETFHDLEVVTYKGQSYITEEMEGLQFRVGPKSFFQTNATQAYELYKIARNFAGLTGNEIVYDLYTGTGTIANFVAKKAQQVIGVEYVAMAIEDAKVNSAINGISNTAFYAGDIKDILNDGFIAEHGQPDVIITDPPRAGMHPDVVDMLLRIAPQKIVYVSCNPATQARDLAMMNEKYRVTAVQPVDMFPHTHHVENVVLLEKI